MIYWSKFTAVLFSLESKDGDRSQLANVTLQFLIPGTSEPVSALVRIQVIFCGCHHSNKLLLFLSLLIPASSFNDCNGPNSHGLPSSYMYMCLGQCCILVHYV